MENKTPAQGAIKLRANAHQRFVIKVGSNVLLREDGSEINGAIRRLAQAIHHFLKSGAEVVLVSSGAIALGRMRMGAAAEETEIALLSAIGQSALTSMYEKAFQELGVLSAQVLVTNEDVRDRRRLGKLCRTLEHCMARGFAAILNENDAATHWANSETRAFHDNDMLAAILSTALKADCLILLTDVDGVFTDHPSAPGARLLRDLAELGGNVSGNTSRHGRGGMSSKVQAVRYAVGHGCRKAVIVNGCRPEVLQEILDGNQVGSVLERKEEHE